MRWARENPEAMEEIANLYPSAHSDHILDALTDQPLPEGSGPVVSSRPPDASELLRPSGEELEEDE